MKQRWFLLVTALCFLTLYVGAAAAAPVLKVGINHFAPLATIDEQNRTGGLFVEILDYIAAEEQWQLQYVPCDWGQCLQWLQQGKVDLLATIAASPERERVFDFTQQHLFLDSGQVFRRHGSSLETVLDLDGATIAVLKNDIYAAGFKQFMAQFPVGFHVLEKNDYREVMAAVATGAVDAGICTTLFGALLEDEFAVEHTAILFSPVKIRIAARKGHQAAVLAAIDRHIADLKADPKSYYYQRLNAILLPQQDLSVPRWVWGLLLGGSVGLLLLLGFSLVLKNRVSARTEELSKTLTDLRHSDQRFRDLLQNLQLATVILASEGTVLFCNDFHLALTGWSKAEVLGRNWFELFVPEPERAQRQERFRRGMTGESWPLHFESAILTRDGQRRVLAWDDILLRDSRGQVNGSASIGRDITAQLSLEEQLRHSQKMEAVGQLAGGIAHDFNNLLSVIIGNADLIRFKCPREQAVLPYVDQVLQAAQRAAQLTQSLLAFSRKQLLEVRSLDLNECIGTMGKLLRRVVRENIEFRQELAPGPLPVMADRGRIEQILMNLVMNAQDAMPTGGELTLAARRINFDSNDAEWHHLVPGEYAHILVRDTGCGMTPEVMARIFDPFFTTKGVGKGTGLGLAMVFGTMKQHNGAVEVDSQPGRGSEFRLFLPLLSQHAAPLEAPEPTVLPPLAGGDETLLLVEDNAEVRQMARSVLEGVGYTVLEAEDGEAALTTFFAQRQRIGLVVLDVIMPKKSGREVFEVIQEQIPAVPVLFTSGYATEILDHQNATETFHFLQKPYPPGALVAKIREILDQA